MRMAKATTLLTTLVILSLETPCTSAGFFSRETQEEVKEPEVLVPQSDETPVEYGVDVSFPIHHDHVTTNYPWLPHNVDPSKPTPKQHEDEPLQVLGDRQQFYNDFLKGCTDKFGRNSRCLSNERDRYAMSYRQPQSMTNYTSLGFKKIRAPEHVWKLIEQFWQDNKHLKFDKEENWGKGNTYTNNWASPTYMVSVEDRTLRGGGTTIKRKIWDAARETIQDWTGEELTDCSLYGIRVYTEGAVLATHVDRLPLVSSAIINVAQDVDEPWPLEVYGHDGKATNVTMLPGDMILYESHSVLHGRPFPLKGRYMANVFIHFEPVGHSLRHNAKQEKAKDNAHVDDKYKQAVARRAGGHEIDEGDNNGLPSYIVPGTPEEANWRRNHPDNKRSTQRRSSVTGSTDNIHAAAQLGDLNAVQKIVANDTKLVHHKDENGWAPIHEATRGGHKDLVKYLHMSGADLNERTNFGKGPTPLYIAETTLGKHHVVSNLLRSLDAISIGPEL
jgi:prolyl 4-hydroxylase